MLPDNTFPVTGGIMQTEEVVPRAQSTGIVSSLTDSLNCQYPLHLLQHLQYQLPELVHMAVKQEPQDDDERARCVINNRFSSNEALNSQQAESSSASTPTEVAHHVHHGHDGMTVHQQLQQATGESTLGQTNQDSINRSRPSSRGRRKSRWKLKFHHQALPPEYLDHYEAALAQEALNSSPTQGYNPNAPSPAPTTSTSTSPSTPSPNTDVQGWLQRITAVQQEISPTNSIENNNSSQSNYRRSVITSSANNYTVNHQPSPRPPMKYSDLPYMGEITLDNSKPRRGRKPKKADICHLIYKNYGTILPGTPGHEERGKDIQERLENNREQSPQINFQRSDIQNRISSLLEKRLTQESKKGTIVLDENKEQNEPLNLCIKDLNQLKIRLLRKHGNIYESGHVKSESSSDNEDIECVDVKNTKKIYLIDTNKLPECINNNDIAINNKNNITNVNNNNNNNNTKNINQNDKNGQNSNGLVYWPNGGVFIHPMALQSQLMYYQKMSKDDNKNQASSIDTTTLTKESKIIPKSIYSMVDSKSPIASPVSVTVTPPSISPRPKRIAQTNQSTNQSTTTAQPTKRKRSAIFIPPMPTENNNNPATEVSICKFKFTGGAKPSLQEKKSLSVDSGGNFRYYSGTGDKSMRGYEFFPRETLQQPAGQATSSAGAFLSAAGERIPPPQLSSSSLSSSSSSCQRVIVADDGRRKRKTRKSLQREKLEQTFKEKGFLIQTQQLESAEGATYCKFRQLRKFTRYLFRSWKDYLPGNVGDLNHNPNDEQTIIAEVDGEQSPSPISNSDLVVMSNVIDENQTLPIA